jgi:glycosyltransferase involved in cell wall biosynthesis
VRDLVVTAFTPTISSGQGLRTYGIVRALAGLGPVDLLYAEFGADEPAAEYEAVDGLRMIPVHPTRGARRLTSYARALADGVPDAFARGSSAELAGLASDLASARGRGRVVADGPVAAANLRRLARRRAVTYNAHNLESSFRHLIGPASDRARRRLERFEARLIRSCEEVWMASPADVDAAHELVPGARIRYVPNVVDTAAINPAPEPAGGVVLFVGDFTYAPNVEALDYLENAILPALWDLLPSARIEVLGRGLDQGGDSDPRISRLGFVPDLREAYARAACVVIPLLSGGGSPLKFVEALAYGSAIVATPAASRGIEALPGRDYLEAADPRSFAAAVAAVLRGERPELRRNGRELAADRYSIESLRARLAQ